MLTMFSFGTIKHNSALFGAVTNYKPQNEIHVGSKPFHQAVEDIQKYYPLYTSDDYLKKIRMIAIAYHLLVPPISVAIITRLFKWCGVDVEEQQIKVVRGFSKEEDNYLSKFRLKPCAAILKTIIFRTEKYTAQDHTKKIQNYLKMQTALTKNGVFVPGNAHGAKRSFWLFPIVVSNRL